MEIPCEDCGAVLGRHNPYFVVFDDHERRCVPCRQARWVAGTWPSKKIPMSREVKEETNRQREQVVAGALSPKVCECEHPIPMGDEEEADSCVRCAKRILRVPA